MLMGSAMALRHLLLVVAVAAAATGTFSTSDAPDKILRQFFDHFCTDCEEACSMLSGTWYFTAPVPPYATATINASSCMTTCKQDTTAPNFCSMGFLSSHDHSQGNTASITFIAQEGTTPNTSVPQCTFGLNDAAYGEVDNAGKLSVIREYYDPEQWAHDLWFCSRTTQQNVKQLLPRHPAFHPQLWEVAKDQMLEFPTSEIEIADTITQSMTLLDRAELVVDDTNATSLCLGMMALYSHRQCANMRAYVTPDFRFEFSGSPAGGVDFDFLEHNCAAPNPPEWITVQESFVENVTSGYFWDFYATASTNPKTGKPCSTIQPESYRCTAVHTSEGLRLSYIHDTFGEEAYSQWAKSCGLSAEHHQRFKALSSS
eukprot:m.949809 g.949809  ORF g.949809 m.949809 type:complete len:372 (-) comp23858_c0_seq6:2250-3365(-)